MSLRHSVATAALTLALAVPAPLAAGVPAVTESRGEGAGASGAEADTRRPEAGTTAGALAAVLGLRSLQETDRRSTAAWGWPLVGRPEVVNAYDPPAQR